MKFAEKLTKIMPRAQKTPEGKIMSFITCFFLLFVLVAIVLGFAVFAKTMKGKPVVSVPSLKGMELLDAMQELQNYGLVADVHERNSKEPLPRGIVFAQHPREGANVRMGGKIVLSVSRGLGDIILSDFKGRFLDDVEEVVYKINDDVNNPNFLTLKIDRVYNAAQVNEVLVQSIEPGTKIEEPTELILQVSQGKWVPTVVVPDLADLPFLEAISNLAAKNIPFTFRYQNRQRKEGLIISQAPAKGTNIKINSFVGLSVGQMKNEKGFIFGIYDLSLPVYKVPLKLTVTVKRPKETGEIYFEMQHPGENVSFPYYQEEETVFTVMVEDKIVDTFIVK